MTALYQHYKGSCYMLLDVATHSETGERLAIYRSMSDGRVWARPHDMFAGAVERDGEITPRFTLIDVNAQYLNPYPTA